MGIFFGFQICLCAGSRKVLLQSKRRVVIHIVEGFTAKSFKAQQTTLKHSIQLYCTAEGFTAENYKAQQTALKHNRQLHCIAKGFTVENFTARQKALMHSRQLQYTVESFTTQQEALCHSRKFCCIAKKSVMRQKLEKSFFCDRNRG